jgi:predicted dehydrogenase
VTVLRWAVVGTGTISRSVVPGLQSCGGAQVALVQSRDPENAARFAEDFGIPESTGDYDAVLTDASIDAIYLATPFATHHRMTRAALLAGKHVLVEKPMTMNAAEASELFTLAAQRGVFLMEAMWMKFSPVFVRLFAEIEKGTIGEPRNLRATFSIPFPNDAGSSKWDVTRSGGALLDQGIYPITLAHALFGKPVGIQAAGTVRADGLDVAEHFTLLYSDGRYAQCASSMAEFGELTASVGGRRGWLTLSPPFWASTDLAIHAGGTRQIFRTPDLVEYPREGSGYVPMLRAVIHAIAQGRTEHPVHTADDTLAVLGTIDEIFAQIR